MTDYSIDGVNNNALRFTASATGSGATTNNYPSSEILDEFRVSAVSNNAEFASVGDVTITTKSGGNLLHGSLFEYLQNADLDATTYGSLSKQKKVRNTFGGSLSGPVTLGPLYNGKDRTFFFVDYEGNRRADSVLQQDSVPTLAMREGDLNGVPGGPAVNPNTGQPFPNNTITDINPVAAKLLSLYYPLPNNSVSGSTLNNYVVEVPVSSRTDGYDIKIDQYLSSKHQLFGRWSWKQIPYQTSNIILPPTNTTETDRNLILSDNYLIAPNLVNEFRFGFSLFRSVPIFPILGIDAYNSLGLTGLKPQLHADAGGFPDFDFSTGTGFTCIQAPGNVAGCGATKDLPFSSGTIEFTDNVSWIVGRHTMKFGYDLRHRNYKEPDDYALGDDFGSFLFFGAFTGNSYADFLLGLPTVSVVAETAPNLNETANQWALYAQDEFHVTKKLTVSYGLRYVVLPPFVDANGNVTNFLPQSNTVVVPDKTVPIAPGFVYAANICPGAIRTAANVPPPSTSLPCSPIETASQAGLPQALRYTYWKNFDPRISAAWRPFDDKTVFRAGFGIYTLVQTGTFGWTLTGVAGTDARTIINGIPSVFTLPQPFVGNGLDPSQIGSESFLYATPVHYRDPQSAQWNVSIEREVGQGFTGRISYIGMNSYRLATTETLNQVPASTQPFNPLAQPYPNWGALSSTENGGFANYQALELQLNHRFASGFMVQGTYDFAKNLTNVIDAGVDALVGDYTINPVVNRFDSRYNRGNSAGTRRHRFLFTGLYELPFGKGRKMLSASNAFVDALLGGWQLSTVTLLETGPYVTPTIDPSTDQSNTNILNRNVSGVRPDLIGNPNVATNGAIWNINAFAPTPANAGRFGDAGVGILEGPGTIAVAGGLSKNFRLRERVRLRFESTFTNLLNHPNFAVPSTSVSSPFFGILTTVQTAENSGNRTGQLSLRLDF